LGKGGSSFAYLAVGILPFVLLCPAHADTVGTATGGFDSNGSGMITIGGTCSTPPCGLTYANQANTVFGVPVNLGTISGNTGKVVGTGQVTSFTGVCSITQDACSETIPCSGLQACLNQTGTFTALTTALGCTCNSACNCAGACELCYAVAGNYTCSSGGCGNGQPASFVAPITALSGTAVSGLPTNAVYVSDGTVTFTNFEDSPINSISHFTGDLVINAFQPSNTGEGSNVSPPPFETDFVNSATDQTTHMKVTVSFDHITGGHCANNLSQPCTLASASTDCFPGSTCLETTTVTALSQASGTIPAKFKIDSGQCAVTKKACSAKVPCASGRQCLMYDAFFFDVSTTTINPGSKEVCLYYPDSNPSDGIVDGTAISETSLAILHFNHTTGNFDPVTEVGYPDTVNNKICGIVPDLSPFVVAVTTNIPGSGNPRTDCINEWNAGSAIVFNERGLPTNRVTCKDGDASCDADGDANGTCTFTLDICPNVTDTRLPDCAPSNIAEYQLLNPPAIAAGANDRVNRTAILDALGALAPAFRHGNSIIYSPPLTAGACASGIQITVPRKSGQTGTGRLRLRARASDGTVDIDSLKLICTP